MVVHLDFNFVLTSFNYTEIKRVFHNHARDLAWTWYSFLKATSATIPENFFARFANSVIQ